MKRIAVVLLVPILVGGCSIKSKAPDAYHLALHACESSGSAAVSLAQQAAKLDPAHFGKLAADELALNANVRAQQPTSSDESNLGGVTREEGTGAGSSYQVILDCKNVSLQLLPGQ